MVDNGAVGGDTMAMNLVGLRILSGVSSNTDLFGCVASGCIVVGGIGVFIF